KSTMFASGVLIGFWRLHHAQKRDWPAESAALDGYAGLRHLVIVPTCGESEDIVADTLHYLSQQDVPLDRVSVLLAFEERDAMAPARAQRLTARFASLFEHFVVTFHPDLEGEVKGKSSNLTWAAKRFEAEIIQAGLIDPRQLIVTVCDADSRLHRHYL